MAAKPATAQGWTPQSSWDHARRVSGDSAAPAPFVASPPSPRPAVVAAPGAPYVRRPPQSYTAEPIDFNPHAHAAPAAQPPTSHSTFCLPRTSSSRDLLSTAGLKSAFEPRDTPSPRRGSADAGTPAGSSNAWRVHPADLRSSSVPAPEPGSGPTTPRTARGGAVEADTTPRGGGNAGTGTGTTGSTPRSAASSSFSARPLHTPPMLLTQQSYLDALDSPSRTSSRSRLAVDIPTTAASEAGRSSSSLSSHASEDDNAWANQLIPSGSSPTRSPLLADSTAQARNPSLAALASGDRESRPMSEFDWVAAYADSRSPSLLQGPHAGAGFDASAGAEPLASPPLPPLPDEMDDEEVASALRAQEEGMAMQGLEIGAGPQRGEEEEHDKPPPVPPLREKPSAAQLAAFDGIPGPPPRSVSPLPALPSEAFPTLHAPPPQHDIGTSPPAARAPFTSPPVPSLDSSLLTPVSLSPAEDRPPSRTSARSGSGSSSSGGRSPRPQPPRPPRRQPSTLSLRSGVSPTADPAPTLAPAAVDVPPPAPALPDSAPLAVPRLRKPLGGSRRASGAGGGPAPNIPEKSARRASTRLSALVVSGTDVPGAADAGGSPALSLVGEAGNRFSVPYSVSDLALAYGRDSWAEYAPPESDSAPPANGNGAPQPHSHFREPASVEESPSLPESNSNRDGAAVPAPTAVPEDDACPSGSGTPRGDAKARAAAFIADLKRAKAAAAAAGTASPVPAEEPSQAEQLVAARPTPPAVTLVTPPSGGVSPALPSPPSMPSPPQRTTRSGSFFTTTARPSISTPSGSPPLPPPDAEKLPSDATLSIRRRSSAVGPIPPSAPAVALPPAAPPLLRHRALPPAIQVAGELKRARTPRERGRIYAKKLNELARERSRLDEWIAGMREVRAVAGRPPLVPASPNASRRAARQDASTATFAPRGDGYKAKELSSYSFSPRDLAPTSAPYPGVLHLGGKGGPPSNASKSSFFSGLGVGRGSLGRRVSKRDHSGSYGSASGTTAAAAKISGPVHLVASTNPSVPPTSLRPIHGPRMPNPVQPGAKERASLDTHYSPSGSPNLSTLAPARASFSYGSGASAGGLSALATSASVPLHLGGGGGGGGRGEGEGDIADGDKLARLQDILPQAAREDLVGALARAGGDDVLAISVYLSEAAARQ